MPVKFSVSVEELRPPALLQREYNRMVRASLEAAARYWIANFLPEHFKPGAATKYGYKARSANYEAIKRLARRVQMWPRTGQFVTAPKPSSPLVWTGALREALLGRQQFNIKATATSKRQAVTIALPIPHPIPPYLRDEIIRVTDAELEVLHRVASRELARQIANLPAIPNTKKLG